MTSCKEVKRLIDESDKPDLLAFEATEHIGRCSDCERFARERAGLRKLLTSGVRVTTPMSFDAALNARLAQVKARRSLWRFTAPGYLRLGAATAALAVMIFAARHAGLFSPGSQPAPQNATLQKPVPIPDGRTVSPESPAVRAPVLVGERQNVRTGIRASRHDAAIGRRLTPAGVLSAEDGGIVIVRGQNGDADIQLPTVSLGAQPLLYVSAGRRAPSSSGTSF
jgi:hypothetical protein